VASDEEAVAAVGLGVGVGVGVGVPVGVGVAVGVEVGVGVGVALGSGVAVLLSSVVLIELSAEGVGDIIGTPGESLSAVSPSTAVPPLCFGKNLVSRKYIEIMPTTIRTNNILTGIKPLSDRDIYVNFDGY
jgi:hypothetical protein